MDQTNNNRSCKKHQNHSLEFIQVKQVNQHSDKTLFYCSACINEDLSFKGLDYILIHQIATQGDNQIIQKWPPIDDQQVIDQLIQLSTKARSNSTVEESIISFFSILKSEIMSKIDLCQKKMVNLNKDQSFDSESILKKYQSISQICELKTLLECNSQSDFYSKEQTCKEFIKSVEDKKERNLQQLQDLLDQSQKKQSQISFDFPNQIKDTILEFIDQITFFDNHNLSQQNYHSNNNRDQSSQLGQSSASERLMKLISNKSNFCSDQFLNEVKVQLSKLNPLLQSLSFNNQFQENKQPIQFDELNHEELCRIDSLTNHLIEIKQNEEYIKELKDSQSVKQLRQILSNKVNFIDNNFIDRFEEFLIQNYPCLRNIDFENVITDTNQFEAVHLLPSQIIHNLLKLSKQMNKPNNQVNPQLLNLINKLKPIINSHFIYVEQQDIEEILNNYPIFDLLQQPDVKDIISMISLEKGDFDGGQQNLIISNQNHLKEVQSKTLNQCNCVSNIVLEKDKKYIFRIQMKRQDQNLKQFMIGLMKSECLHSIHGFSNNLSCYLQQNQNSNEIILHGSDYGIFKDLKGNGFKVNCNNNEQIELRVCIDEQILEVLDYPNYNYKIGLSDQFKQNIVDHKDLRFYIYVYESQQIITLQQAFIVKQFNN